MGQVIIEKSDKSLLRNHLPGILSVSREAVDDLIQRFPSEAAAIAKVFLYLSQRFKREWSEHTLVKVPLEKCFVKNDELSPFHDGLGGSLRFLMKKNFVDEDVQIFSDQLDARLELCYFLTKALDECCKSAHRALYVDMLTWDEKSKGEFGDKGLNFDVKLGHSIERMEDYFERIAKFIDFILRDTASQCRLEPPLRVDVNGYLRALQEVNVYLSEGYFVGRQILSGEVDSDGDGFFLDLNFSTDRDSLLAKWACLSDLQDSLLVRVVANISANRAILEHNFYIGLQRIASAMLVSFLGKLKPDGWEEVMWDFFEEWRCVYSSDDNIFRFLRMHFGQDGIFVNAFNSGSRFMTDRDLDLVVNWSLYLQDQYIKNRGNLGDLDLSKKQHGSFNNRMIFALVVVGAFFEKTKVPREFVGQRNSTYSVFPAPGESPAKPGPHAEEFLHIAYGQVYYGNSGWRLLPDGIPAYADLTMKKRFALQKLAWILVKGLSAPEILKNYIAMEHLNESDGSWLYVRYQK